MAAKSSLRVGQTVSFGDSTHPTTSGVIRKLNPKTARIACKGKGTFDVSYNLIKAGKGKRKATKTTKRKGRRVLRDLDAAWEKQERYLPADIWSRGMYSNPAGKRRRKKRKATKRRRPIATRRRATRNPATPRRNSKGQFVSSRRKAARRRTRRRR